MPTGVLKGTLGFPRIGTSPVFWGPSVSFAIRVIDLDF